MDNASHTPRPGEDDIYALARAFALRTDLNLFVTGKAGTGKTTFLKEVCRAPGGKNVVVTAPTGIAAINAEGATLHSCFQLPLQPFVPTDEGRRGFIASLRVETPKRKLLRSMETLIIDEISMVRADTLDAIDTELRHFRQNDQPFGGVQVIMIGDLFQLAPVVTEADAQVLNSYYPSPFFFDSQVITAHPPVCLEFNHIFRQSDPGFIALLNALRENRLTTAQRDALKALHQPDQSVPDDYVVLTSHNRQADAINASRLDSLKGEGRQYTASISGDFPESMRPTERALTLKEGARVMFLRNNLAKGYYNGKIGVVTRITGSQVEVTDSGNGARVQVEPETWSNVSYRVNPESGTVESVETGTFRQLPLRLAWAVTIHKSQGLTFDKVAIDAARSFASGQVYVALSRCRSMENLRLLSPVPFNRLRQHPGVLEFCRRAASPAELRTLLEENERRFQLKLVWGLYDFSDSLKDMETIRKLLYSQRKSGGQEPLEHVKSLLADAREGQEVATGFQRQVYTRMRKNWDPRWMQERLAAAAGYFTPRLRTWTNTLHDLDFRCDSAKAVKDFDRTGRNVQERLLAQERMMPLMGEEFSVERYYACRKRVQPQRPQGHSRPTDDAPRLIRAFARLRHDLAELRGFIHDSSGLPEREALTDQSLEDLTRFLPLTPSDLQRVKGVAPQVARDFGDEILDVLRAFTEGNGLTSRMDEYEEE